MKRLPAFLCLLLMTALGWTAAAAYDYPFDDPYVATVIGTPSEFQPDLPKKIPLTIYGLRIFKNRKPPQVFWYHDRLRYSLASQNQEAPLIFLIAGTGARYNSFRMQLLQKVFFQAGFHVVALTSPTDPSFIVTASTLSVPGDLGCDSEDLYSVMKQAWHQVRRRVSASEFYLAGYSLGAAQAAFIARLDEDKRAFNFKKVLLINPPVSLYCSARILDNMLVDNIPGGLENFNAFFEEMMVKFSQVYQTMTYLDVSEDFLYTIYQKLRPEKSKLAALIGVSFRMASADMVFATDVMTRAGLIVPPNLTLSPYQSLTDYFKVCLQTAFRDYFEELFYPFFQRRDPLVTRAALIENLSLKSIEGYLKTSSKIFLMTNADELILAPGDLEFFQNVFGSRAKIYPRGGHCGNMLFKDNVNDMIDFIKN